MKVTPVFLIAFPYVERGWERAAFSESNPFLSMRKFILVD
jgi:hypothetical protein